MRVERLDLIAFGPFSKATLDLSAPGVYMVHGPNEAGKSSLLAALRALLYGIPMQTPFDFVHAKRDLKLGAVLSLDGESIEVIRHKRRNDTLTAPDGTPIPEGRLAGFLHGVSEQVFTSTFALTLKELREGGKGLIRGEGDIGQALYSAQSSLDLGVVLDELRSRREELYLPRGKSKPLNQASSQYSALTKRIDEAATATEQFVGLREEVERAEGEFTRLDDLFRAARAEHERWKNLQAAFAPLQTRQQASREKAQLESEGPVAPRDAEERMRVLQETVTSSRSRREQIQRSIAALQAGLTDLEIDPVLLAAHSEVASLVRSAEANDRTVRSLGESGRTVETLRAEAALKLHRVRPERSTDEIGVLQVPAALETRITSLVKEHRALIPRTDHARTDLAAKAAAVEETRTLVEEPVDSGDKGVLASVVKNAPPRLVEEFIRCRESLVATSAELTSMAAESGWAPQAHPALLEAAVPSRAEVAAHRARVTDHAAQVKSQRTEHTKATRELGTAEGELEALRSLMDPPSVEDLRQGREHRDALLVEIRQEGLSEELFTGLESALRDTDALADRLREHSDATAQRLVLEKQVRALQHDVLQRSEVLESLTRESRDLEHEWESLWPEKTVPAPPLDTAEVVLGRLDSLRRLCRQRDEQQENLALWRRTAESLIDQLLSLLGEAGVSSKTLQAKNDDDGRMILLVPELIDLAEAELRRRAEAVRQRSAARLRVSSAEGELKQAQRTSSEVEKALSDWRNRWCQTLVAAGFSSEIPPEEVEAELSLLHEVSDLLRQADEVERDAARAREETAEFDQRLESAFARCGQTVPTDRFERAHALETLDRRVTTNARDHERAERLREDLTSAESESNEVLSAEQEAQRRLTALWQEFAVENASELRAAVARTVEVTRQQKRIDEAQDHLAGLGDITVLEQHTFGLTESEVREHLEQAGQERDELSRRRDAANTTRAQAHSAFAQVDGTAKAAYWADERSELMAKTGELTEEYVRLTLAEQLLLSRVEAYRQENQDPVLRRAEELFRRFTLGLFTHLRPDVDDKGKNVLWVVRRNGREEKISALSEGTADQLYLALRLASLERFAEADQTMPFVMDDVLMSFDEERSTAVLHVLDEMAERFQIVVFTHHDRLAEIAEHTLGKGRAHLRPLPRFEPSR